MAVISYCHRTFDEKSNNRETYSTVPFSKDAQLYYSDFIRIALQKGIFVCGYERVKPGYRFTSISHGFYLQFIVNGAGEYNGMPFQKNNLFVIRPEAKRTLIASEETPWESYWCVWKRDLSEKPMKRLGQLSQDMIYHVSNSTHLFALFDYMIFGRHQESNLEEIVESFTELLLGDLQVIGAYQNFSAKQVETVKQIRKMIREEYTTLTVEEISKRTHFNRRYLATIFRQTTGETMQTTIQKEKLHAAVNTLIGGNSSVAEAASTSGFENYTTFLKAFRKEYRMTPSEFINMVRREDSERSIPSD